MTQRERFDRIALAVLAAVVVAAVFCICAAKPADAAPGDLEARAYKPLGPDVNLSVGAGVAVEIATVPETWPLFPGRLVFLDGLTVRGKYAAGASISRRKATEDDHWRLWAAGWKEGGFQGAFGIAYGYPLEWGF